MCNFPSLVHEFSSRLGNLLHKLDCKEFLKYCMLYSMAGLLLNQIIVDLLCLSTVNHRALFLQLAERMHMLDIGPLKLDAKDICQSYYCSKSCSSKFSLSEWLRIIYNKVKDQASYSVFVQIHHSIGTFYWYKWELDMENNPSPLRVLRNNLINSHNHPIDEKPQDSLLSCSC